MNFSQLLAEKNIRQGIVCSSKKRLFEMIGRLAAEQLAVQTNIQDFDELQCFESLFNREKLGNTAIGNGVAMPRARLPAGSNPIAIFLQLSSPIDYDAPDRREVDLIFAILIPENLCPDYTKVLSELAERLIEKNLCKQLRAAKNEQEIWQIFEFADHLKNESNE